MFYNVCSLYNICVTISHSANELIKLFIFLFLQPPNGRLPLKNADAMQLAVLEKNNWPTFLIELPRRGSHGTEEPQTVRLEGNELTN